MLIDYHADHSVGHPELQLAWMKVTRLHLTGYFEESLRNGCNGAGQYHLGCHSILIAIRADEVASIGRLGQA